MSSLIDSDDSDDDFLLQERAFAKPKPTEKLELTPIKTLQQIVSGKSASPAEDDKKESVGQKRPRRHPPNKNLAKLKKSKLEIESDANEKVRNDRQNDPEWIETQARKTVDEVLMLDVVENINNLDDIGWYRSAKKSGKNVIYYPAISSQNKTEARTLLKERKNKNFKTKKIQYLGVSWRYALAHEEIALSNWIPISECSELDNEKRLKNFIQAIAKTSLLKKDPMGLKIEELALRKMWERVKTQKEQREHDEEQERAELMESLNTIKDLAAVAPSITVTQESDSNTYDDKQKDYTDSDSDDADDDNDANSLSPGRNPKRQTPLHVDDQIEFYHSMAVFGNASALEKATIVGIRPDNKKHPLLLSNSIIPLPSYHRVRRLPGGKWQPISEFVLLKEGKQSLADSGTGLNKAIQGMRRIRDEVSKAKDDYWKNGHGTIKGDEKTQAQVRIVRRSNRRRRTTL
mmetsp:Transcript_17185/g.39701  ORF Transcript_17185/g.39701 Transcript_17185/m.39701 type:complete len:461 (-) Transcript_17185:98-1480(-)